MKEAHRLSLGGAQIFRARVYGGKKDVQRVVASGGVARPGVHAERTEIVRGEVESRLLANLSKRRLDGGLARFSRAPCNAPVVGEQNVGTVVPELQEHPPLRVHKHHTGRHVRRHAVSSRYAADATKASTRRSTSGVKGRGSARGGKNAKPCPSPTTSDAAGRSSRAA